jgi:hypothetical protein
MRQPLREIKVGSVGSVAVRQKPKRHAGAGHKVRILLINLPQHDQIYQNTVLTDDQQINCSFEYAKQCST